MNDETLRRIKVAYCIWSWGDGHQCAGDCGAYMGEPGKRCPEGGDDVIDIIKREVALGPQAEGDDE